MYFRLFFIAVFCLCFTTILSIQCYLGTDGQCVLESDMTVCGSNENEKCQCAKYSFQCTEGDSACTEYEQSHNVVKWAYIIVSTDVCEQMKQAPTMYQQLTCCSTNKCNRPDNGKCSWSQGRRRVLNKLTDLLDF